jgi:lysozyme
MKFGIDVSKWQGNFNFEQAKKEGVEFVILRGAYAKGKDTKFDTYYVDCKSLSLPVGVYHYSMATTVEGAIAEAEFLYDKVLKGKQFELPIYIDVEDKTQLALPKRLLTDIVKAWCNYLETRKYYVGIYAGVYTLAGNVYDEELKRYTHWIPYWGTKCIYKGDYGIWQFGGETNRLRDVHVAGVVCDQNYLYKDFTATIKSKKLNGYSAPEEIITKPAPPFKPGDKVKLIEGATYFNGKKIPLWLFSRALCVRSNQLENGNYNISTASTGAITGRVNQKYLKKI